MTANVLFRKEIVLEGMVVVLVWKGLAVSIF